MLVMSQVAGLVVQLGSRVYYVHLPKSTHIIGPIYLSYFPFHVTESIIFVSYLVVCSSEYFEEIKFFSATNEKNFPPAESNSDCWI